MSYRERKRCSGNLTFEKSDYIIFIGKRWVGLEDYFFLFTCFFIFAVAYLWGVKPAKITWDPDKVEIELNEGESIRFSVKFKSDSDISSAELWITPSLKDIVRVEPSELEIEADKKYEIILNISGGSPGLFEGTLHVRDGKRTLAEPLSIKVKIKSSGSSQNSAWSEEVEDNVSENSEFEDDLCSSGAGGAERSQDWKRWKEWPYEKPSIEDMREVASERGDAFVFEFKPIWDEMFKNEPKAPDGFLIFHVAVFLTSATEASINLKVPEGLRVFGGTSFQIGEIPAMEVRSFYVPIKLCGNFGTFPVVAHFEYSDGRGLHRKLGRALLFIIREHRRSIKAMKPQEYVQFLEEERLKKFKKREGAEFYPPIAYAYEPTPLGELNLVSEVDPFLPAEPKEVFNFYPYLPSNVDIEFEETSTEIEPWETQNQPQSQQSPRLKAEGFYVKACYNFVGRIIIRSPEAAYTNSSNDEPLAGASVIAYDDDGGTSADDFICAARTDRAGRFICSGCAEDPFYSGRPDPYIIVYASNGKVSVVSTSSITYSQVIARYESLIGASYDLGIVRVGGVDPLSFLLRAFWVFRFTNVAFMVNSVGDIGNYTIVYPINETSKYSRPNIYIGSEDAASPSVVAHEFGRALMDRLYGFKSFPSPGGVNHSFCYNDLEEGKQREREGLALAEGFANAVALITFSTSLYCDPGLPWNTSLPHICINLEPSTVRREDDNPTNRWDHHFCGDCGSGSRFCFPGQQNEGYVTSAIWDLVDGIYSPEDRDCFFHESNGRNACDAANFSWVSLLGILPSRPQNYSGFVSSLFLSCEDRNKERKTSRFNSIFTGDHLICQPSNPPGGGGGLPPGGGGGGCSSSTHSDLQLLPLVFLYYFYYYLRLKKNRKIKKYAFQR
ncbi:hypothetical protein HRbin19_00130 [bacterium HR19]|nr:hypothetical protein HRbin19_00130 [bacterium HR19]